MPRKQTREEVIERVRQMNPNIEMRDDIPYVNTMTKVRWRCLVCGHEWEVMPCPVLRGHGCPKCGIRKCADSQRLSREEVIERVRQINPNVEMRDDIQYVDTRTKVGWRCLVCGYEWMAAPADRLQGKGCPKCRIRKCADSRRLPKEDIVERIRKINPDIEMVGQYNGSRKKTEFRCLRCNHRWMAEPSTVAAGHSCPECHRRRRSAIITENHRKHGDVVCTYEEAVERAKQFKNRKEFKDKEPKLYKYVIGRKWLDTFDWLEGRANPYSDRMDSVYAYEFETLRTVYVGRTINVGRRNREHTDGIYRSSVRKFSDEHEVEIPNMKILASGLSLEEGLRMEDEFLTRYIENGWTALNKGKTGVGSGSLGGIAAKKWNKKTCYAAAKECKNRNEFEKRYHAASVSSRIHGWINDYTWFPDVKRWTYEECREVALGYNTMKGFREKSSKAYHAAEYHGWLKRFDWLKKARKDDWTFDEVKELASRYETLHDFETHEKKAAYQARKNGWLLKFVWLRRLCQPN